MGVSLFDEAREDSSKDILVSARVAVAPSQGDVVVAFEQLDIAN